MKFREKILAFISCSNFHLNSLSSFFKELKYKIFSGHQMHFVVVGSVCTLCLKNA